MHLVEIFIDEKIQLFLFYFFEWNWAKKKLKASTCVSEQAKN